MRARHADKACAAMTVHLQNLNDYLEDQSRSKALLKPGKGVAKVADKGVARRSAAVKRVRSSA